MTELRRGRVRKMRAGMGRERARGRRGEWEDGERRRGGEGRT